MVVYHIYNGIANIEFKTLSALQVSSLQGTTSETHAISFLQYCRKHTTYILTILYLDVAAFLAFTHLKKKRKNNEYSVNIIKYRSKVT